MFQTFFARKIHAWKSDHPKAPGVIPMALFSEPVAICGVILRVLLSNEPRFPYSENVRLNSRPGLRYMIYYFHFGISAQIEWKSWVMENPMPHVCVWIMVYLIIICISFNKRGIGMCHNFDDLTVPGGAKRSMELSSSCPT